MSVELTNEQKECKYQIIKWFKNPNKPYYYYSGAAGTGKTTLIQSVLEDIGLADSEIISCAYVGKAVLVLTQHGLKACTIHALCYHPIFKTVDESSLDSDGNMITRKKRKMEFALKDKLDGISLIIVDECAMVNDKMRKDILSFGIPVVMMGDKNQLPPVFGKCSILDYPDFTLTQIMRQKEGDPIVYLSQRVLNGKDLEYGTYGKSKVIEYRAVDRSILTDYDMILCAKNKTRDLLNTEIRKNVLGIYNIEPIVGDKMICRQNMWDEITDGFPLTNGLVGIVRDIDYSSMYRNIIYMDFQPDFMENSFENLFLDYKYLKTPIQYRKDYGMSDNIKFEYAYAITTHLSQGSEYQDVLFMDEWFHDAETTRRLRYTAITRARNSITIVPDRTRPSKFCIYDKI